MTREERAALAGEYVLGTLTQAERRNVEQARRDDADLDAAIDYWQSRFAPLLEATKAEAPPLRVWAGIDARLQAEDLIAPSNVVPLVPVARPSTGWRVATVLTGAIAAALAGFIVYDKNRPPIPPGEGNFIAVVNRSAEEPALILKVDINAGTVTVRNVAATTPADRSLELWYIAGAGVAPRSMGVVGGDVRNARLPVSTVATDALFAVTVEQPGGSTLGVPTGPVIYSGKLIKD